MRGTTTILTVTGVITALIGLGVIAPRTFLGLAFGIKANDAPTTIMARHWFLLVALVGGLLVYAARHPEVRAPAMIVGATEKLVLGALVIVSPLRARRLTMLIVGADGIMGLLYVFLLTQRNLS